MIKFLVEYFWLGPLILCFLYISGEWFSVTCARMRRQQNTIEYEGNFELNAFSQNDTDNLKRFRPRFLIYLLGVLIIFWFLCIPDQKNLYLFVAGLLILHQLMINMIHTRNWFFYRYAFGSDGINGHLFYPRYITWRLSSWESLTYAIFYLFLSLFTLQWFFFGGFVSCVFIALRMSKFAQKPRLNKSSAT